MNTSSTDNTKSNPTDEAKNTQPLTLSALLAESLSAKKDEVGYPQPNKSRFSQRPSRPPHGTRRAMGKR